HIQFGGDLAPKLHPSCLDEPMSQNEMKLTSLRHSVPISAAAFRHIEVLVHINVLPQIIRL
ncbi:hypothetical protein, partial [Erythrobacter sp. QSSC1-22B]|uniref:hypothetical protein n=1 Tax=Erythrobacter sp. QSSC1-22B TaxID=1860125 RepID=UPI001F2998E5